jgi:hypothetical protein
MAQLPQNRNRIRDNWLNFFVGSPKRFLWTCFGIFILFAMSAPNYAAQALANVVNVFVAAFGPSAGPLLTLAIAIGGIWIIIRGIFPKKKGKNGH